MVRNKAFLQPKINKNQFQEIREAKDIKFYMFNKFYERAGRQIFVNGEKGLRKLDKSLPLVVYIHGFTESAPGSMRKLFKFEF